MLASCDLIGCSLLQVVAAAEGSEVEMVMEMVVEEEVSAKWRLSMCLKIEYYIVHLMQVCNY